MRRMRRQPSLYSLVVCASRQSLPLATALRSLSLSHCLIPDLTTIPEPTTESAQHTAHQPFVRHIMRMFHRIVTLLILPFVALGCPEPVAQLCRCADMHNGVVLDCSGSPAHGVTAALKANQAMLGLVQSLTMHNSQLTSLPANFFAGLFIKKLDLSSNNISTVDDHAFDGMNSVLQELILSHNKISKIPVKSIAGLSSLLRLDLSNNTINEITEADAFPFMTKLFDINLGSNNISAVHTSAFGNIKNCIQTINLGSNSLTVVPSSAIRGLKQLQSLHLHKNSIKQLEALNFLNLPVLNLLNLASNQIKELNRQAFLNVPNLRYLYLTDNHIAQLFSHQFSSFEQLEMLDMTNNMITEIPSESFSGLTQLRQLYLSNNQIAKIQKNAFTNSSIVILVVSNNQLTELQDDVISGLSSIQQISFKANKIKEIHQNAFYNAPSLVMVDLSKNQIQDISPSTFLAQLNLLLIDLSGNKLIRTPYAAFNRRVGTVLLKENPLVCTEKIHMLQDGTGININDSEDIICGGTPKPTTTLAPSTLMQMPKMSPRKSPGAHHSTQESQEVILPSGAFQAAGLVTQAPVKHHTVASSRFVQSDDSETVIEQETEEESLPEFQIDQLSDSLPENPIAVERPESSKEMLPTRNEEAESDEAATTPLPARRFTDIADNPNLIHPFPVPFLKRGPKQNQAARVVTATEPSSTEIHTLPPSILIEPGSTPRFNTNHTQVVKTGSQEHFEEFHLRTEPVKETEIPYPAPAQPKSMFPTTLVIICVGSALVVMIAVILGLCISKHSLRQMAFENTYSDTSVPRGAGDYGSAYGNIGAYSNAHTVRTIGRFDESQPWIYNPGANYCNYYK